MNGLILLKIYYMTKKKIRTIKSFLKNQKILTWDDIFLNDILPFWKKLVNKRK
mgnify:CR=1 FL=1